MNRLALALGIVVAGAMAIRSAEAQNAAPSATPAAAASAVPGASAVPEASSPPEDPAVTKLATSLVAQAQSGTIDRTLLSPNMSAGLTPEMVGQIAAQLGPLGKPSSVAYVTQASRDAYRVYRYRVVWPSKTLEELIVLNGDGKVAGWFFKPDSPATP